jgi:hypothetical protein
MEETSLDKFICELLIDLPLSRNKGSKSISNSLPIFWVSKAILGEGERRFG